MTELLSIAPTLKAPVPDWETKYAEHERRDAKLRPVNKTAVFDALAAAGILHRCRRFRWLRRRRPDRERRSQSRRGPRCPAIRIGRDRVNCLGPGRARSPRR